MPSKYGAVKEWRKNNPDKVAAQARRRRARDPKPFRQASLKYRQAHLEAVQTKDREAQRKRRADPNAKQRLREYKDRQEGKKVAIAGRPRPEQCELCGETSKVVFDHCHQQGHFRGWICDRCNRTLGQVKDSTDLLRKMIRYLEGASGSTNIEAEEQADGEYLRLA